MPAAAEEKVGESSSFTVWPLVDYRENASGDTSTLSILGPFFRLHRQGANRETALRPLFFTEEAAPDASSTYILYPVASSYSTSLISSTQVVGLFQHTNYPGDEGGDSGGTTLFPFYFSGHSETHGPYRAFFPLYGDLYGRFWRDEQHFVLFPLYSRTVRKGTTSTNFLFPVFSLISGEKEQGFQLWPLYGKAEKEGVYHSTFALWPIYSHSTSGLDTPNPVEKTFVFPFFTSSVSPVRTERHYLWPFFGHIDDREKNQEQWDILWPLWVVARGEQGEMDRFLPFYSREQRKDTRKEWLLWPLYRHEETNSDTFEQESHRFLFFLYSDYRNKLPKIGSESRRTALWPLFFYREETGEFSRLSMPALVEPIFDKPGIERCWAPLWRVYQQAWNERGDSALSLFWNLYWREKSGNDLAFELFPLVYYRSERGHTDLKFFKGLVGYDERQGRREISFFWLPFGIGWGTETSGPLSARKGD
jgi:hypothetical protein